MKNTKPFLQQLKLNSVALISLATALSGVFYDTWRDHHKPQYLR